MQNTQRIDAIIARIKTVLACPTTRELVGLRRMTVIEGIAFLSVAIAHPIYTPVDCANNFNAMRVIGQENLYVDIAFACSSLCDAIADTKGLSTIGQTSGPTEADLYTTQIAPIVIARIERKNSSSFMALMTRLELVALEPILQPVVQRDQRDFIDIFGRIHDTTDNALDFINNMDNEIDNAIAMNQRNDTEGSQDQEVLNQLDFYDLDDLTDPDRGIAEGIVAVAGFPDDEVPEPTVYIAKDGSVVTGNIEDFKKSEWWQNDHHHCRTFFN